MTRPALFVVVLVASTLTLTAQQPSPTFEVATIRPSGNINADEHSAVQPNGQFIVTNTRLSDLIRDVFEVQRHELVFGDQLPSWVASDKWDIIGKGPPITDEVAQRPLLFAMMRNLLIDQFKLVTHREQRNTPVYALVVARADRRLGSQIRPSSADCPALLAAFKATGVRQTPGSPVCGLRNSRNQLWGTGVALTDLTRILSLTVGRPVIDATNLTGSFDLDVKFTPDDASDQARSIAMVTAIQDQLGLRLEPRQAPISVLVVTSAQRPSLD